MNPIAELCRRKKNILSVYFTAGFPKLEDTATLIRLLEANGADLIEVGIPFSDPLADGPVIQHSSEVALKNGMTLEHLFAQLCSMPKPGIPLLLMGYLNPVLQYGVEAFCRKAREAGVSGVIIPDLPLQEYLDLYKTIFERYGIISVFLISPQTSEDRIRLIDEHSEGFIYMVSSASTTGGTQALAGLHEAYFERVRNMKLKNPLLIGFGISDGAAFRKAGSYAAGAIVGSAFIRAISESDNLEQTVKDFVLQLTQTNTQKKQTT